MASEPIPDEPLPRGRAWRGVLWTAIGSAGYIDNGSAFDARDTRLGRYQNGTFSLQFTPT